MIPKDYHILPFTADGWGASGIYFMPRAANGQLILIRCTQVWERDCRP